MKIYISLLVFTLLGTSQQSVDNKILGCWNFDASRKIFVKSSKLKGKGLAFEFKNDHTIKFTYHSGRCGNEKPQFREGAWDIKDSVLTISYNIYDKFTASHFGVKKNVSSHFVIEKITSQILVLHAIK